MKILVYRYLDYKKYLNELIASKPKNGRGIKALLARTMGSPVSHVSQVLKGGSHLSMEQAESVNLFFNHDEDESSFFLLLVQLAKAGTNSLKDRLKKQIKKQSEIFFNLKNQLETTRAINKEDQAEFYSSWIYGAVHILLTIPKYHSSDLISKYLGIDKNKTQKILAFLVSTGLAKKISTDHYIIGEARIHLDNSSALITKFHTNWRIKAIGAFDDINFHKNLHYSSVVSVSEEDYLKIKNTLIDCIQNVKKIIHPSEAEGLHCFNLDFFRL